MRRVVVTGLGAVSPHGLTTSDFWNGLLDGKSSTGPLTQFNSESFPSRVAGGVPGYKVTDYVPKSYRKATKIMARDIELAVLAADGALRDAKIATRGILEAGGGKKPDETWYVPDPARVGCNIGAGLICADLTELAAAIAEAKSPDGNLDMRRWGRSDDPSRTSGMENLTPLWLLKYLPNMLACHVSIIHDTQGPSNTITCGQASAGLALGEACRTIARGQADIALVGGCESIIHPVGLMRWALLNRLATKSNDSPAQACRPLDMQADGTVVAEGGGVLVIEELQSAKARRAEIYCEISGSGESSTAGEICQAQPTGEALSVAMEKALAKAAISPADIDVVIPSAYGVAAYDQADAAAINRVFKGHKPVVAAARGGLGDCGAGSQAIDLVAAALTVDSQAIFPTVNNQHPIAGLRVSHSRVDQADIRHVMVMSTSLAGQNSVVILRRFTGAD